MPIDRALAWLSALRFEGAEALIAEPLLKELSHRLRFLSGVGLDYLSLARAMGETWADRVDLALTLLEAGVFSVPVNFLSPIPGTPLGARPVLSPDEARRIVILLRFLLPDRHIRICGGRPTVFGAHEPLAPMRQLSKTAYAVTVTRFPDVLQESLSADLAAPALDGRADELPVVAVGGPHGREGGRVAAGAFLGPQVTQAQPHGTLPSPKRRRPTSRTVPIRPARPKWAQGRSDRSAFSASDGRDDRVPGRVDGNTGVCAGAGATTTGAGLATGTGTGAWVDGIGTV